MTFGELECPLRISSPMNTRFLLEMFFGLYFGDSWGVLSDSLDSHPYEGCVRDSKDGLVEQFLNHDRL